MSAPSADDIRLLAAKALQSVLDETARSVAKQYSVSTNVCTMAFMIGAYAAAVGQVTDHSAEEVLSNIVEGARAFIADTRDGGGQVGMGAVQ